ncbi:MAG: YgfZ/GcvT domain-containing protein [Woeseiaceae bacterium]
MPEVDIELYKLIKVSGADAVDFLQGQLTQDVAKLATAGRMLAAWCNAKGRVIVVARLAAIDDGIAMIVPADMADKVLETLLMYRFRAKVELDATDDDYLELVATHDTDPVALIQAGIPHIDSSNTESFTPHMLNLDKLDAISFTKGCYTGQEIVARTEHRGKSKRRMMRYLAHEAGIAVGATVEDGDRKVGEVVNVAGRELLAVTPVERHQQDLRVGTITVSPQGLPYDL